MTAWSWSLMLGRATPVRVIVFRTAGWVAVYRDYPPAHDHDAGQRPRSMSMKRRATGVGAPQQASRSAVALEELHDLHGFGSSIRNSSSRQDDGCCRIASVKRDIEGMSSQ